MRNQHIKGFTIVELLIVIVVIGILAAITIVAYNGIQDRARIATVSSDLTGAAKQLALYQVDAGQYPAALTDLNNGQGAKMSSGTSLQYTSSGSAYCLTATNSATTYKISSGGSAPSAGGCAGHGVGGVAPVTNFATNPSVENSATSWAVWYAGGNGTFTRPTTGGYSGSSHMRATWTTASTVGAGGIYFGNSPQAVQVGTTYTLSGYVRTNVSKPLRASIEWYSSASAKTGDTFGTTVTVSPNTWTRLSVSGPAPAGTAWARISLYATGPAWNVNETLDADALMFVQGSSVSAYADGSSTDWVWNGTTHESSSTGPAL
jgi:prepilin-type N-terminal cleavage/methylation domain-containing protein